MIYFLTEDDEKYVKIGLSSSQKRLPLRIDELQTGNWRKLKLIGTCEGCKKVEKNLHELFDEYWVLGEWFENRGRLKKFIQTKIDKVIE